MAEYRGYEETAHVTEDWFRRLYKLGPTPIDSTEDVQPVYEHTSPQVLRAAEHLSRTATKSIAEFERWAGGSFSCFDDLRKAVERFEGARMAQEPRKED
jgi:hypothetical protein